MKKKLSYKLQRELEALPGKIDEAEGHRGAAGGHFRSGVLSAGARGDRRGAGPPRGAKQLELDGLLERWAELEE